MMQFTEEQRKALIAELKSEKAVLEEWRDEWNARDKVNHSAICIALAVLAAKPAGLLEDVIGGNGANAYRFRKNKDAVLHFGMPLYTVPPVAEPVAPDFSDCPLCDSNYISGMQAGYKFGAEQDITGFNSAVEHCRKEMRGSRALRLNTIAPAEGKE